MRLLFALLFLSGCSSLSVKNDSPSVIDQSQVQLHTLKVSVNGQEYKGTGVLPIAERYKITVFPEEKIEEIVWNTCHQFNRVQRPSTGWFNKSFSFIFKPTIGIEDKASCALKISVLTKDVAMDFALLEFQDSRPEVGLNALLKCNGKTENVRGVGVCQSAAGLRQEILFRQPVVVNPSPDCAVFSSKDEIEWTFDIAPSECTYYFVSNERASNGKRYIFRLRTLGATKFRP